MFQFSSGSAYGLINNTQPRKFGALQDISIDVSFTTKSLFGQNQFPLTIARGQGKITGKAKAAQLNGAMLNDLFFSQSTTAQSLMPIFGEAGTVPGTAAYTITVANGANFAQDLGVRDANTGQEFTRGLAAAGTYDVNTSTGVYTFSAADANRAVVIDYTYKVSTAGLQLNLSQQLSGTTPTFALFLVTKYGAKPLYLNLVAVTSSKLSMATKMDDFMVPEFDFEAMANSAGVVGTLALGE